jgi:FtsZ-binding cell division protein ZapB
MDEMTLKNEVRKLSIEIEDLKEKNKQLQNEFTLHDA